MSQDCALKLSGVSKRYEHFALQSIDLTVEPGTVMGFIGPNGAGKTTSLRIALGLIKPDSGQVEVYGKAIPEEQVEAKWQ
ncbi:MAG: ATP-binding cassette domain-containing protein, partial [Pseudomonadota bacterium]